MLLQTLLIDGYISQTFRSQATEKYFQNLLKSTSVQPHVTYSHNGRDGNFFFVHSVPRHIPVQLSNMQGGWLLDRGIVDRGTVIPQMMWSPHSAIDRRQYVEKANLQMPIYLRDNDGNLGVSLGSLMQSRCHVLIDPDDYASLGPSTTTHIRIAVSMVVSRSTAARLP